MSGSRLRLAVPGRTLVLVAGMPGAGKSTLLASLPRRRGLVVLDSDAQRAALLAVLPGLPYGLYRPLVHLWHRLAVLFAALSDASTVVVHLPATRPGTRAAVARLAASTGRDAHLVWLSVDPAEALRGQAARGRLVPSASFQRHAEHATEPPAAAERGWAGVTLTDRRGVAAGLDLVLGSATPHRVDHGLEVVREDRQAAISP